MTNNIQTEPDSLTGAASAPYSSGESTPDSEDSISLTPEMELPTAEALHAVKEKISKLKNGNHSIIRRYRHEQELKPYQAELIRLQQHLEQDNKRMVVLFEGRSAAGKGGAIRRITHYLNEKHYRTVALGKPDDEERSQWYFQRYMSRLPRAGEIVLFDTSWYSRAMVEPVLGFCSPKEYQDFIRGVRGFENDLTRQNTLLIKLYFSISKKEQEKRFNRRQADPLRHWKQDEADIQIQDRRSEFTDMKRRMLRWTHTHGAPWTIIRSDIKHTARLNAMKVILNSVPYQQVDPYLDLTPDPAVVISGASELKLMRAKRLKSYAPRG